MQCGPENLYGFERDINSLIDAFALQAQLEQTLSYLTFKRLFRAGGYAYLHQAYSGCEHSPEYTQLLYATALNRLDLFSPTAPASSALWLMHVDKAAAAEAGAAAAGSQAAAKPQQRWSLAGVEQTALAAGAAAGAAAKAAAGRATTAAAGAACVPAAVLVQQQQQQQRTIRQTSSANSLLLNNDLLLDGSVSEQQQQQQQQQQQHVELKLQPQQVPAAQLPLLGASLQQQQQPSPPLGLQQQGQQESACLLGPQHLLDPGDGAEEKQQQQQQQQGWAADQPLLPAAAAAAGVDLLASNNDELDDDDFFNDLLAIFDEAEGLLDDAADAAAALPPAAVAQPAGAAAAGTAAAVDKLAVAQQHPQQQQQRPAMVVPVAVKAGVVFMLHCLHDTQLNLPPAAIYTSLQQLQLLQQAAVQFSAAGAAGADALGALQLLLARQRFLVGQFRRPVHWVPQLPMWLAPPKPRYPDLGLGLAAANMAAARAHNGARVAAVHAAANAARSLRANPRSVDPAVHREALFHIKTALRSLANFRSLQALCGKYASARQAIFEPLLRIKEPQVPGDDQRQQQQQQPQEQQGQKQQQGRKRGGKGKADSASKRKKQIAESQGVDRPQKALLLLQEQQQQEKQQQERQQQAAAAAEAARAAGIPELFDRNFGTNLSQLAGDEAAQMLVLLDPSRKPGYVRQALNKQQQALQAAEDAGRAAAKGGSSSAHLRKLAGSVQQQQQRKAAGASKAAASRAGSAASAAMLRQQQQQGWQYLQELCAAGVLQPAELHELQEDESEGSVQGLGAAAQVLQLQRERRQHTLVLAEQWFRSHDAMLMQADDDEDMP
uniref:Uncharacterized protein n=1 Tax=Tetradesmus obliquus TaxID=3088 RepID=A0A383VF32_TETOB